MAGPHSLAVPSRLVPTIIVVRVCLGNGMAGHGEDSMAKARESFLWNRGITVTAVVAADTVQEVPGPHSLALSQLMPTI